VFIENELSESVSMTLTSALGRELQKIEIEGNARYEMDLTQYSSGMYFLTSADGRVEKLIIQ
jgi:hypothetical protein